MDISAATLSDSYDHFKIASERLEAKDTDGSVFWFSPQQSILGYQNVSLSVDLSEYGVLESTDYVKVSVSIDGGAYQNINDLGGTNGSKTDDFTSATASVSGLSGSTIQIRIEMKKIIVTRLFLPMSAFFPMKLVTYFVSVVRVSYSLHLRSLKVVQGGPALAAP